MHPNSKNAYTINLCDVYSELVCELVSVKLVSVDGLLPTGYYLFHPKYGINLVRYGSN